MYKALYYYTYSQCGSEGDDRGVRHTCCAKKKQVFCSTKCINQHHCRVTVGATGLEIVYIIGREEYTVRGNDPGDMLQGNRLCTGSAAERGRQV